MQRLTHWPDRIADRDGLEASYISGMPIGPKHGQRPEDVIEPRTIIPPVRVTDGPARTSEDGLKDVTIINIGRLEDGQPLFSRVIDLIKDPHGVHSNLT